MEELKKYSTAQLVEELSSRDNVQAFFMGLYSNSPYSIKVDIEDRSIPGITKKIVPTYCDVILVGHDRQDPEDDLVVRNIQSMKTES